jgi:peptide/nickel transport system substrate-binding protein
MKSIRTFPSRPKYSLGGAALTAAAIATFVAPASAAAVHGGKAIDPVAPSLSPATTFRYFTSSSWGDAVSFNPYSSNYPTTNFALVALPLGYPPQAPLPYGDYYPELASSWSISGQNITINLRSDADWQTGAPVTSQDVLTSLLLAGADGNGLWGQVSRVATLGSKALRISVIAPNVPALVLNEVMQVPIVPSSEYGHFIPANFESDLFTYWRIYNPLHPSSATENAAAASAAHKTMTQVLSALVHYNPPSLIGDGPFKVVRATTYQILLEKWPGFWDAAKISEPSVTITALSSGASAGALFSGLIDLDVDNLLTPAEIKRVDHTPGLVHITALTNTNEQGIWFNQREYPMNLVQVRKAIAYLVNRQNWAALDGPNPATKNEDDLQDVQAKDYLTQAQLDALNHYPYNPSQAKQLLEAVGFTQKNGSWYEPTGQPFAVTISADAGIEGQVTGALIVQSDLQRFGIKASVTTVDAGSFFQDFSQGTINADMTVFFSSAGSLDPLSYFDWTLATNAPALGVSNYVAPGSNAVPKPFIANVPGLGRVNVITTLNNEASYAPPSEWRSLVWDWARYVNSQLPVIPLVSDVVTEFYSTSRYTDWPARSSILWTQYTVPEILYFNQDGYLRLR